MRRGWGGRIRAGGQDLRRIDSGWTDPPLWNFGSVTRSGNLNDIARLTSPSHTPATGCELFPTSADMISQTRDDTTPGAQSWGRGQAFPALCNATTREDHPAPAPRCRYGSTRARTAILMCSGRFGHAEERASGTLPSPSVVAFCMHPACIGTVPFGFSSVRSVPFWGSGEELSFPLDFLDFERREWDSNPRTGQARLRFSRPVHSTALPSLRRCNEPPLGHRNVWEPRAGEVYMSQIPSCQGSSSSTNIRSGKRLAGSPKNAISASARDVGTDQLTGRGCPRSGKTALELRHLANCWQSPGEMLGFGETARATSTGAHGPIPGVVRTTKHEHPPHLRGCS